MTFEPTRLLTVVYAASPEKRLTVGRLARKDRQILFEYDPQFIAAGLQLSPFKLPLRPGVFDGGPELFDGLFGVFDDSLPDGWGRLLIDRRAAKMGLRADQLGPLDRLSLVGARAMGALQYLPAQQLDPPELVDLRQLAAEIDHVQRGATQGELERLLAIGGSPQGARPKALVQVSDDAETITTDQTPAAGFTPSMVKFLAKEDDPYAGVLELAYLKMARAAGIDAAVGRMLGAHRRHPGYLSVARFDRQGVKRLHLHSLGGLLHASHRLPSVTYAELLLATRSLTSDERAVEEMFRRACFNVFAHNRDDHTRNFAFLMEDDGRWRPSPAYDLTFSTGPGGEHSMLVASEGRNPTPAHLRELAKLGDVKHATRIIDQVRSAVDGFFAHADDAGVPKKLRDAIGGRIGALRKARRTV